MTHQTAVVARSTPSPALDAVGFAADARHGWAGGDGVILATVDGGTSWHREWTGTRIVTGITVLDARHVWATAAVARPGDNPLVTTLLRTSDGGVHWMSLPLHHPLGRLTFTTPLLGWAIDAVGSANPPAIGRLVRTFDGGRTWVATGISGIGAVCFQSQRVGYTAGRYVYRTGDGGGSWQRRAGMGLGDVGGPLELGCDGLAVWVFVDRGGGAGGHVDYAAYRSTDAARHFTRLLGNSFFPGTPKGIANADAEPGPFVAPDASTAIELGMSPAGEESSITVTHDGGRHWLTLTLDEVGNNAAGIAFPDARHGWIVANARNEGYLLATADGGRTWSRRYPTAVPAPVAGISFVSASVGFGLGVPGDERAVEATRDGGTTWRQIGRLPADQSPIANGGVAGGPRLVSFPDPSDGWAVSPYGNLFATHDGGKAWSKVAVPAETPFVAGVLFADPAHGCAIASSDSGDYIELITDDGGRSWREVRIRASLPICAHGQAGQLLGISATRAFNPAIPSVNADLTIVDGSTAWATVTDSGPSGGLARTLDGGTTWTEYDWPEETDPMRAPVSQMDVSFVDPRHGWVLTWDGAAYRTSDGGSSWTELP